MSKGKNLKKNTSNALKGERSFSAEELSRLRKRVLEGDVSLGIQDLLPVLANEKSNNADNLNFLAKWSVFISNKIESLDNKQVIEIFSHLSRMNFYNDKLFNDLLNKAKDNLASMSINDISSIVVSLGKLKYYNQNFLDEISPLIINSRELADTRQVSTFLHNIGRLGYFNPDLIDHLTDKFNLQISAENSRETPTDISLALLGIAKLGIYNPEHLSNIMGRITTQERGFSNQDRIISAFALTMIKENSNPDNKIAIENHIQVLMQGIDLDQVNTIEDKRQIIVSFYNLSQREQEGLSTTIKTKIPEWNEELKDDTKKTVEITYTQAKMSNFVKEKFPGKEILDEYYINEIGTSVDIYIPPINFVIQVNGPHHYCKHNPSLETATSNFNKELLERYKYKQLRVNVLNADWQNTIETTLRNEFEIIKQARKEITQAKKPKEVKDLEGGIPYDPFTDYITKKTASIVIEEQVAEQQKESISISNNSKNSSKKNKSARNNKASKDKADLKAINEALKYNEAEIAKQQKQEKLQDDLMYAIIWNYLDNLKNAIKNGANVNNELSNELLKSYKYPIILALAPGRENIEIVEELLKAGGNVNAVDKSGNSPIILASQINGSIGTDLVKILLEFGANPNVINNQAGSPLMFACLDSNDESAKTLYSAGANLNVCDVNGLSLLCLAIQKLPWLAEIIIKNGQTDLNHVNPILNKNDEKDTPRYYTALGFAIDLAGESNSNRLVEMLVEAGADINFFKNPIDPAICRAIHTGNKELVSYLLEHGADCNLEYSNTRENSTPFIMLTFSSEMNEVTKKLINENKVKNINKKGKFFEKDEQGKAQTIPCNAIFNSIKHKNADLFAFLLASGAQVLEDKWKSLFSQEKEEIFERYEKDPVKYIIEYDHPVENKIRALDRLAEFSLESEKILKAKKMLKAELEAKQVKEEIAGKISSADLSSNITPPIAVKTDLGQEIGRKK